LAIYDCADALSNYGVVIDAQDAYLTLILADIMLEERLSLSGAPKQLGFRLHAPQ
jgi:hypothetical protein